MTSPKAERWWSVPCAVVALEGALSRLTSGRSPWSSDLMLAVGGAVALAWIGSALSSRWPRAGQIPTALVVVAIGANLSVLPLLEVRATWPVAAFLGFACAALAFAPVALGRPARARPTLALMWALTGVSWATDYARGTPAPGALEAFGLAGAAAGSLALGPGLGWVAPAALWPADALPETGHRSILATDRAPDVLLVSIDTLRADAARSMTSIDRLAADGAVFQGQASAPWTVPAMASVMTGLEPHHHGAGRSFAADASAAPHYTSIRAATPTLAELLAAAGYDTYASIRSPFLEAPSLGFLRGFDVVDLGPRHDGVRPRLPWSGRSTLAVAEAARQLGWAPPQHEGVELQVDQLLAAYRRPHDGPWFGWLHVYEPHLPYRDAGSADLSPAEAIDALCYDEVVGSAPPDRARAAALRVAYDHEVAVVDRALVRLLDSLPAPTRPRVIVLLSDHGEEFLDHGGFGHGGTFYQESLAVPIVVEGLPGLRGGAARQIDVAPTLLAAAGVVAPAMDGRGLAEAVTMDPPMRSENALSGDLSQRAVLLGDTKVIASQAGARMFDLATDPLERIALDPPPDLAAELPEAPAAAQTTPEIDLILHAKLRAAGYVE